ISKPYAVVFMNKLCYTTYQRAKDILDQYNKTVYNFKVIDLDHSEILQFIIRSFQSDAARAAQTAVEYPELHFTTVVSQVQETRAIHNGVLCNPALYLSCAVSTFASLVFPLCAADTTHHEEQS
ncbi:hypothetical protein STEG23_003564, partial [Scotinomys teguina]